MDFDLNTTCESSEGHCNEDSETVLASNSTELRTIEQLEGLLKPESKVDSLDVAYSLYCEYGRHVGFSVRKARQDYFRKTEVVKAKIFLCSCEGVSDNRASKNRIASFKKQHFRTNCRARLRVSREVDGDWSVSTFHKEHNHEVFAPDQSYLLRTARHLSDAKAATIEAFQAVGIGVRQTCRYMAKECGGIQNIGFTDRDAYNHVRNTKAVTKVENGDASALLKYFNDKSSREPFFYWSAMLDDDGRLMNFFFRDSRCASDYECFGDVLSVDTTFKTNKYNLICAPFVGINHHRRNVMFALAFLSDETTATFLWLFSTFLDSMQGKEPQIVFSDQCQALMQGIDGNFRAARHRLCQWHVSQNATAHFGRLNGNKEFWKLWHRCMSQCDTETEFEETWQSMVDGYGIREKPWFNTMYKLRRKWASVFTNDRFSAGLKATSRSEVTNKVFKDLCKSTSSLHEVVMLYESMLASWRVKERADDAYNIGRPGQFISENRLLAQAAMAYTRNVYELFESEVSKTLNVDLIQQPIDYSAIELQYLVKSHGTSSKVRAVQYNRFLRTISCTCRMWETDGILCRHALKIMYSINLICIPEQYILKRWTKAARNRTQNDIVTPCTGDLPSDVLFVNNIMRLMYNMAHACKDDAPLRYALNQRIHGMHDEFAGASNVKRAKKRKGSGVRVQSPVRPFLDPPVAERGWYPVKRQVRNSPKVTEKNKRVKTGMATLFEGHDDGRYPGEQSDSVSNSIGAWCSNSQSQSGVPSSPNESASSRSRGVTAASYMEMQTQNSRASA